jgi:hypothetical protein
MLLALGLPQTWQPMDAKATIPPMIFACPQGHDLWTLSVARNDKMDHVQVRFEPTINVSLSNATKSMNRSVTDAGTTYRVDYAGAAQHGLARLQIDFVMPAGHDGVSEAHFTLKSGGKTIEGQCMRAPNGFPGWENNAEAWK